jgi:hypothetical protein
VYPSPLSSLDRRSDFFSDGRRHQVLWVTSVTSEPQPARAGGVTSGRERERGIS